MKSLKDKYKKIFSSKNDKKDKDYTYLLIRAVAAILIIYFIITINNQQNEIDNLKIIYEDRAYQYEEKQKELKKIENELKNTDSKEFIEKQAREKLKMVKSNETVYIDINKNKNEDI